MRKLVLVALAIFIIGSSLNFANVNAAIGTGVLQVYTNSARTFEAPKQDDLYYVTVGQTYYIRVLGVTEFSSGSSVTIKIGWTDTSGTPQTTFIPNVPVLSSDGTRYIDFPWTIPLDAKISTNANVHYKGSSGPDYLAQGTIRPVGFMHIIPEVPLGITGSLLALVAGFGLFKIKKNKRVSVIN